MRPTLLVFRYSLLACAPPAAAQQARSLLSAEPVVETSAGTQAWKVRYWTTTAENRPIQVTGMVVAPRKASPTRARDVIAWTHGTWGVAESCAPSLSNRFFELTPAVQAVRSGKVVVAPDYPASARPCPTPISPDAPRPAPSWTRFVRLSRSPARPPVAPSWGGEKARVAMRRYGPASEPAPMLRSSRFSASRPGGPADRSP